MRLLDSYVADLGSPDVSQLSEIERTGKMRTLLIRLLAARSGQLLVASALGSDVRLLQSISAPMVVHDEPALRRSSLRPA